jgi:nucleoid-associated protein YgaU
LAKSIFGRIIDVLNTPLPPILPTGPTKSAGKAKAAEAEKPAAKAEAKTKSKAPTRAGAPPVVVPPSIVVNKQGQTKAIDLTAELRKRQAALKEQAALAETAALKKKLAEQEAELTRLRHEYEQKLAEEAKTHTATEAWTYTVERGDTLWGISSKMYGKGSRWKEIYEANTDKIKNPSLIYPGQVFVIPDKN